MTGEVRVEQARLMIAATRAVIPDIRPTAAYAERALTIAMELCRPAYDAIYLACAEAIGGILVTADHRLSRKVHATSFASLVLAIDDSTLLVQLGDEPTAIRLDILEALARPALDAAGIRSISIPNRR